MTSGLSGFGLSQTGITFGGLASGLDTGAIISALMAIEQRPITAMQVKRQSYVNQKSLFSDLEQRLETLKDKVDDVRLASSFLEYAAAVEDETYFSASAGQGAKAGSYQIEVQSLAQGQVSHSNTRSSANLTLLGGSSSLTFTVGSNSPVTIDFDNQTYTLQEVADEINAQAIGVSAQVLEVSTGNYQLVVTGDVGLENAITQSRSATGDFVSLGTELNTNQAQAASDATVEINGISVTRSSNQISDAIPGVTLDLHAMSPAGQTTQLTVSTDTTATGAKVQALVDAYNSVVDFIQGQQVLDPNTNQPTSPLFGDSTLRSIQTALRGIVGGSVSTGNEAYELLSQIGISSDTDGRLTFTQSEFDAAVVADEDAVKTLFTDSTSGIASRLYSQADDYLDTVDGLLVTRQNGYDDRIDQLDDQIEQAQRRLTQTQVSLQQKFANLEVLLGQLQSQGSALGGLPQLFGNNN